MNLSLSLVYFTVLSARTIQHEMTDELERIWKEEAIAKLRYYPSICLKELIKTMNDLIRNSWQPNEELNLKPSKCGVLTAHSLFAFGCDFFSVS